MTDSPATARVRHWLAELDAALSRGDAPGAAMLFREDGYWRDLVAFTWNIRTLEGRGEIAAMLRDTLARTQPSGWTLEGEATEANGVTEAWLRFDTAVGRGRGVLRLKDGQGWTLMTQLAELKGFEEAHGDTRPRGVRHNAYGSGQRTWAEQRADDAAELGVTRQPYCLIIGGGQGGIALGARLKRLGVPALIIDSHPRPGDAWRSRYKSLVLHDPVWYDHLPYLPFPDHWPVFTPKDKMGDWLESYTKIMELDYWGSSPCVGARWDEDEQTWSVTVDRAGTRCVVRPRQLILATGMSGLPEMPRFSGAERFAGVQLHSSHYPGGEAWKGRKVVVVGSNNSAHDICADLWEHGAQVTMVQRSSTLVARSETLQELGWGKLFSEDALRRGVTTERADMTLASMPFKVLTEAQKGVTAQIAQKDADFYDRLRKVGFMLDFGEDGSGLSLKYMRRGSGYYIDVGASELLANGSIALRSGVTVREIREHSVVLDDGTELGADLIVYATGFGSMTGWAEMMISREVAERVGPCWGLGSGTAKDPGPWEGELRNMWKPTHQPGLWFHGGNLQQSRFYSLLLALQLKARMEGLATPVWGMRPAQEAGT
jgi:putative flavoprotein involved in K+ transport